MRTSTFTINGKTYILDWDLYEAQAKFDEQRSRELESSPEFVRMMSNVLKKMVESEPKPVRGFLGYKMKK